MARKSDYGLMIWDCKSTGTLSNVIELLKEGKKSVVFVNKNKDFLNISDTSDLKRLTALMSDHARAKAEEKIGLSAKIANIVHNQLPLGIGENYQTLPEPVKEREAGQSSEGIGTLSESAKLRAALMATLKDHISRAQLSQSQAAKVFGVTQPRISDLTRGKVDLFGLDALVNMAATAGLQVELHISEADVAVRP